MRKLLISTIATTLVLTGCSTPSNNASTEPGTVSSTNKTTEPTSSSTKEEKTTSTSKPIQPTKSKDKKKPSSTKKLKDRKKTANPNVSKPQMKGVIKDDKISGKTKDGKGIKCGLWQHEKIPQVFFKSEACTKEFEQYNKIQPQMPVKIAGSGCFLNSRSVIPTENLKSIDSMRVLPNTKIVMFERKNNLYESFIFSCMPDTLFKNTPKR